MYSNFLTYYTCHKSDLLRENKLDYGEGRWTLVKKLRIKSVTQE